MLSHIKLRETCHEIRERLATAHEIVFFTGAGLSSESGIPTFRDSAHGLWAHFRPEHVATPQAFRNRPKRALDWYVDRWTQVRGAHPNPGHEAIAALEREFSSKRISVLTQNVDGFHQAAGSQRVYELHGSIHRLRCHARCGHTANWLVAEEAYRPCPICQSPRRPDLVWFGEELDAETFKLAEDAALHADVFITIGTSAVVQPAARLHRMAHGVGALVVEVNPAESALSEHTSYSLRCTAGAFFEALLGP